MSDAYLPMPFEFLKIIRKVRGSNRICLDAVAKLGRAWVEVNRNSRAPGVTEVIVTDGPRKLVPGPFAVSAPAASGAESIDWRPKATEFPAQNAPGNRQKSP